MRVLHLLRALRVGGLESVVVNLVNGLARRGIECDVGCLLEAGEWASRVQARRVWVGGLEQRGKVLTVLDLGRYLRRERITLLHTHNSQAHLLGVAAAALARVPVVHTKHGQNWPDDPRWVWKSRQASRLTRRIVAVSGDIAHIVTDIERVPAAKVATIPNGVDTSAFVAGAGPAAAARTRRRAEAGFAADAFVIGSVGRLAWEKNYELLVDAFALVHARAPDARLLIVGEGPYRARIEAAARARGVFGACSFPGASDDVPGWLQAMDVFCLSSLTEGLSITLLEAGAAGLPAVVTRVGGNAEVVVDGETGVVVPSADAAAMAAAFEGLRREADRRARLGAAARQRVAATYSVARMVDDYAALYSAVAGAGA